MQNLKSSPLFDLNLPLFIDFIISRLPILLYLGVVYKVLTHIIGIKWKNMEIMLVRIRIMTNANTK